MSKKPLPSSGELLDPAGVEGLVLVDIPAYGLKCGERSTLDPATAEALTLAGSFDPSAPVD